MSQLVERATILGRFTVAKFYADDDLRRATPYEVLEGDNAVLTTGASALWNRFAGLGAVTAFDATNGRLAVGDGTTAVATSQTDLVGTNKFRKVFDAAPTVSGRAFTCVTTFVAGEATFTWNECGVANAASAGILFDRALVGFGAKGSGTQWVLTGTLSIP